jgi:4-amino-4-deoxy-L-arabinose transferase-like glycosyltransferase
MSNADQVKMFFSMFAVYVPTLVICLVAGVVILAKWRQAGRGAVWALLGFGLALILCFAMPLGHTLLQHWVFQSGDRASRIWAFTAFSVFGSVLHAVVYALLLVAIFAGRSKPEAAIPPAFNGP